MKQAWLVLLVASALVACGGSGSDDTGIDDTIDAGNDTPDVEEEVVVKECTKADDCLAVLGAADQCEDLICDEADWTCKRAPKEVGTKCSDGDPCTKGDACDAAGACLAGADECECRADLQCLSKEDGDLCNGTLKCDVSNLPFKCVLDTTTVVTCPHAADTTCATNECDPGTGECSLTPVTNGTGCDDGDVCTGPDTCQAGACLGTELGCECTDDLDCLPYDDGDLCTGYYICDTAALPYTCILAAGSTVTCPTTNDTDCMKNQCEPATGGCALAPAETGTVCDDGNFCTDDDGCAIDGDTGDGVCKGGKPRDCTDGNVCTNDGCDKFAQKCTYVFNNGPCEDYNKCLDGDTCQFGMCLGGNNPKSCNDNDACTTDSCETTTGCKHVAKDCSDGDVCTVDLCDAATGACTYKPFLCGDGDLCTTDSCEPGVGCVFAPKACADGDLCTTDACRPDNGACEHAPVVCTDDDPCTDDACDGATGLCASAPKDCADGDACTADACDSLLGDCTNTPVAVDDGEVCTVDSCDPATGDITHAPKDCSDGLPCTTDVCDPLTAECSNPAVPIDDADACTTDACDPDTGVVSHVAKDCGDGLACTLDACDPLTAECSNPPVLCDDLNVCTLDGCDPADGACVFDDAAADGGPCDDGYDFTAGDACAAGECLGLVTAPASTFRVASVQIEAPAFVYDLGQGPVDLNDALGALVSSLLGPDGYGESILVFSPLPPVFSFDRGTLAQGRGACLYDGDLAATHCGILPASPVAASGPVAYDDEGACSDDPLVEALCYRAPETDAAPVPLPVFDLQAVTSWTTGHFDGTSTTTVEALDGYLLAFVASADLAALPLKDDTLGLDIMASDALVHLSPEVFDGVEGFWLRVRFAAHAVAAYPAGAGCNADGAACDDASLCTNDSCHALTGDCVYAAIDGIDDGAPCTVDACDPATAAITHDPEVCDDASLCTDDACDALTGDCVFTAIVGLDDADPCTVDACDPATAAITHDPKVCDDADPCTIDACDWNTGDCVFVAKNCDDTDACTADACDLLTGDCTHDARVCNDGNSCTLDGCDAASGDCTVTPLDDGEACDDGDPGTVTDTCTSGACAGSVPPPLYVRSRVLRWVSPDLTWDLGGGDAVVNTNVSDLATKHVQDGTFADEFIPTPMFGIAPFHVALPGAKLQFAYGACDDLALPIQLTCTVDPDFPYGAVAIETWAQSGTCSDVPLLEAPCVRTSSGATAVLFGGNTLPLAEAWMGATLDGDPVSAITRVTIFGFVTATDAETALILVNETDRIPLADLLAAVPTETLAEIPGWWLRLEYDAEPFQILGTD